MIWGGGGCSLCSGAWIAGGVFSGKSSKLGLRLVIFDSIGIGLFILPKLATLILSGFFIKPNLVG